MTSIRILDGAVGTVLEQKGFQADPVLWTAEAALEVPNLLHSIHSDYISAGADIITAHTFRTTAYAYQKAHRPASDAFRALQSAVRIARSSITQSDRNVLLAGSLAPYEDCYRPDLTPGVDVLKPHHEQQIQWLVESGVDLLIAETINTYHEAVTILELGQEAKIPTWISLLPGPDSTFNTLPMLTTVINGLRANGVEMILLNCRPLEEMDHWVSVFSGNDLAWGVYANGPGGPDPSCGWNPQGLPCEELFVNSALKWIDQGASVIGGCCGSTPSMIAALRHAITTSNIPGVS